MTGTDAAEADHRRAAAGPGLAPFSPGDRAVRVLRRNSAEVVVLVAFGVSRIVARLAGVAMYSADIETLWQTIDFSALRHEYWSSIWFSNTEPPLFNALLGAVLKWSPLDLNRSFTVLYTLLGAVLAVSLVRLLRRCGASWVAAVVVSTLVVVSPTTILFENWAFYEFPVAVALVVIAAAIARMVERPRARTALLVLGLAALVCLTRALFHPVWLLAVAVLLVLATPAAQRRRVAALGCIPVLVVGVFVIRNLALWGTPTQSSWFGGNLSRITVLMVDYDTRSSWVADGKTQALVVPPFSPRQDYDAELGPCQVGDGEPMVLAEPVKASGISNFNQLCYREVWDADLAASKVVLERRPSAYLKGVADAWFISMQPARAAGGTDPNSTELNGYYKAWSRSLLLTVTRYLPFHFPDQGPYLHPIDGTFTPADVSITIFVATLGAMAALPIGAWRWWRRGRSVTRVTLTFMGLTTAWVMVVGNGADMTENYRFRFLVEPLVLVVLGLAVDRTVRWVAHRIGGREHGSDVRDPATEASTVEGRAG